MKTWFNNNIRFTSCGTFIFLWIIFVIYIYTYTISLSDNATWRWYSHHIVRQPANSTITFHFALQNLPDRRPILTMGNINGTWSKAYSMGLWLINVFTSNLSATILRGHKSWLKKVKTGTNIQKSSNISRSSSKWWYNGKNVLIN